MRIKYNRTSTLQQEGERFKLDKDNYDLTLFDKGISGKIPFSEREKGKELTELVESGKVNEVVATFGQLNMKAFNGTKNKSRKDFLALVDRCIEDDLEISLV